MLSIREGRELADACMKRKAVFQTGIEDRSLVHFHKMVEWVRNGAIGKLERFEVKLPAGLDFPPEEPTSPPPDLDWNLWQGPAQFHAYMKSRTDAWHWRKISMYSQGAILDMGTHLADTGQIIANGSIKKTGTSDALIFRKIVPSLPGSRPAEDLIDISAWQK